MYKEAAAINFNNLFYQSQNHFKYVIKIILINEIFFFLPNQLFKICCIFYCYSTSQFRPATFQVLNCHIWLMASILDSVDLDAQRI